MNIKRQFRYNRKEGSNYVFNYKTNEWLFLIINTSTEIPTIQQRTYEVFSKSEPIMHYQNLLDESIPKTGLRYRLFTLESTKGVITPEDRKFIYNGEIFKLDRDLYIRQNSKIRDGISALEEYIINSIIKKSR